MLRRRCDWLLQLCAARRCWWYLLDAFPRSGVNHRPGRQRGQGWWSTGEQQEREDSGFTNRSSEEKECLFQALRNHCPGSFSENKAVSVTELPKLQLRCDWLAGHLMLAGGAAAGGEAGVCPVTYSHFTAVWTEAVAELRSTVIFCHRWFLSERYQRAV